MEYHTTKQYVQRTEHRPWGKFTILADQPDHKVKRLLVKPGCRLSLQRHKHRREHWLVVSGSGEVTRNEERRLLHTGDSIDIEAGDIHRVQNSSNVDLVFVEIQLGDYFGEDDIERLENDYGRIDGSEVKP